MNMKIDRYTGEPYDADEWTAHTRKSNRERLDRIADGIEEEMRLAEHGERHGRH